MFTAAFLHDFPWVHCTNNCIRIPDRLPTKTKVIKQKERVCLYPGYKGSKLQNKAVSNNSDLLRKVCSHELHMTPLYPAPLFCLSLSFTTQSTLERYLVISRAQNCCTVIQLAVTFLARCTALLLSLSSSISFLPLPPSSLRHTSSLCVLDWMACKWSGCLGGLSSGPKRVSKRERERRKKKIDSHLLSIWVRTVVPAVRRWEKAGWRLP